MLQTKSTQRVQRMSTSDQTFIARTERLFLGYSVYEEISGKIIEAIEQMQLKPKQHSLVIATSWRHLSNSKALMRLYRTESSSNT